MTDYTKLTETLHFMGSQLNKSAADAIEAQNTELLKSSEYVDELQAQIQSLQFDYKALQGENERLKADYLEVERLCDATYVAKGADAYNHACDEMERFQNQRRKAGKKVGTERSLCDGMAWLYRHVSDVEAERDALQAKLDALQTHEPVQFLADATRFKLTFDAKGRVSTMWAHMEKLEGRWVALVAAEDDCHLKLAAPKALEPLTLLSAAFRTTVAHGLNEDYCMVFKFKDLDSLHAADDEWRKFRGAP